MRPRNWPLLAAPLLAAAVAGCASEPSCENHKALDEAIADHDEHERVRRQEMIRKGIGVRIELMKLFDSAHPPVAECRRCEGDVDRLLRVRSQ